MRERSELARKGIARGRSVVALVYDEGVLFVAENPSRSLHKISELYDRVGFAAVGKYNEFDNLRRGGILFADTRGYPYDRRDVTGRAAGQHVRADAGHHLHRAGQALRGGAVRRRGRHYGETKPPELYRITYDGSIVDEPNFVVMGGTTEPIVTALKESYAENADLRGAMGIAVEALRAGSAESPDKDQPSLGVGRLEVATLDVTGRAGRSAGSAGPTRKARCRKGCEGQTAGPDSRTDGESPIGQRPEASRPHITRRGSALGAGGARACRPTLQLPRLAAIRCKT